LQFGHHACGKSITPIPAMQEYHYFYHSATFKKFEKFENIFCQQVSKIHSNEFGDFVVIDFFQWIFQSMFNFNPLKPN
jgi:hypothetical protein